MHGEELEVLQVVSQIINTQRRVAVKLAQTEQPEVAALESGPVVLHRVSEAVFLSTRPAAS